MSMKCSDIPDQLVIDGIRELRRADNYTGYWMWVQCWELRPWLETQVGIRLSDNLYFAKMRKLIKRKVIDGCPCGCRGDYEITPKSKAYDVALDTADTSAYEARKRAERQQRDEARYQQWLGSLV